jgi:hypothetical protein
VLHPEEELTAMLEGLSFGEEAKKVEVDEDREWEDVAEDGMEGAESASMDGVMLPGSMDGAMLPGRVVN